MFTGYILGTIPAITFPYRYWCVCLNCVIFFLFFLFTQSECARRKLHCDASENGQAAGTAGQLRQ